MSGEAEKTERAYVYMVRCAGGQLYTGWTNDPASRLHCQHQARQLPAAGQYPVETIIHNIDAGHTYYFH